MKEGETLTLLREAVYRRGGNMTGISGVAADLCTIIDHEIRLWRYDRDRLALTGGGVTQESGCRATVWQKLKMTKGWTSAR